jgi:hypothetical protein
MGVKSTDENQKIGAVCNEVTGETIARKSNAVFNLLFLKK